MKIRAFGFLFFQKMRFHPDNIAIQSISFFVKLVTYGRFQCHFL
ncbi:hypothetical protein HMPREF0495_02079 [Levilactobacillus brevis ATCC 14869 = DSM 20054]|uniref:Uncharacterized protein n=1 Tax=Levilactobacillus brevis ATCC 14869 = DSM 20054 TaxID=649758 RepID=U2NUR8_LEVBR|nr:hypothetical protein HMPREF0495_02079 [Levilactobacillus brevis ATCC 14869 = DSM 20054]